MIGLEALCDQMRQYAEIISVPPAMMPSCNAPNRGGLHIGLTSDGKKYVLTYSEKDLTDTLLISKKAEPILEAAFDQLTLNLAGQRISTRTIGPDDILSAPQMPPPGHLFDFEIKMNEAQEDLLGQINPQWAERQKQRNAHLINEKKKRFGE
ncbi:hypothetical protein [Asticcacaulis sp.]|uniref:hypothetical protein n=1 Tax=Asticcacaulis sp. TaxID=1872648 RepID=UPI003F7C3F4E